MAITNNLTPDLVVAGLTPWLGNQLDGASEVTIDDVRVTSVNGLSNETILFRASWTKDGTRDQRRLVARVQPAGEGAFPEYNVAKEAQIMRALAKHSNLPVPAVLWQSDDPEILGAPFLIMDFVDGRVPADDPPFTAGGWVLELTPEERAQMYDNGIQQLAVLGTLNPYDLGLGFLAEEDNAPGLANQVERWRNIFTWATEGEDNPTIEQALEWLEANQPQDEDDLIISWGDSRLGNLLFADDMSVAAVIDWEDVTLNAFGADLAWWLVMNRHHTDGIGAPVPDGFPSPEQTVKRYEELTGRTVENLQYLEVFAATKLAILMVRAAHMLIAAGLLPPDSTMALNNPGAKVLSDTLGFGALEGDTVSYIGNR